MVKIIAKLLWNFELPVNRPEQALLGGMSGGWWDPAQPGFPWVVANASSWVFAGTGLKNGDSLAGLVGFEYDKVNSGYPIPPGLYSKCFTGRRSFTEARCCEFDTLYSSEWCTHLQRGNISMVVGS